MRRFRDAPKQYDPQWAREVISTLEQELDKLRRPAQQGYSVSGTLTQTRTLDVDAATAAEVRTFLGQLVQDLKDRGMLG